MHFRLVRITPVWLAVALATLGPIQTAFSQMCTFAENQDVINPIRVDGFPDEMRANDAGECCELCESVPGCIFAEYRPIFDRCLLLQGGEVVRSNDNRRVFVQPVDDSTDVNIVLCSREESDISCPVGTSLRLDSVFFGRDDPELCDNEDVPDPVCTSLLAPQIARNICNGLESCTLSARSSDLGGDPCDGVSKYLRVQYRCIQDGAMPITTTTTQAQVTTTRGNGAGLTTTAEGAQITPAPSAAVEDGAQVFPTFPGAGSSASESTVIASPPSTGSVLDAMPLWLWIIIPTSAFICCLVAACVGWRIRSDLRPKHDRQLDQRVSYAV